MSLKVIREQILNFVSHSAPSVMVIKGDWGVGKTFGWESILLEAQRESMISAKKYTYVSLFGISNLDKLKYSIFENSVSKEFIGNEPNLESLRSNTFGLLEVLGRGSWSKLKEMPFLKSAAPAVEAFSFMSVSDYLICIDDLERKGGNLDLKDVLGLVSLLKEKKKCKIVLMLNDKTQDTKDYEQYKEKIVDIELEFSPTPMESALVAFNNKKTYHSELSEITVSLGIKNIRVLKRIDRSIDLVFHYFENAEVEIKSQLLRVTALFCWAYYCSVYDKDIPSLDFIESIDSIYLLDSKMLDDERKQWKNVLLSHNFNKLDDLNRMLAKLVRRGYIDRAEFEAVVSTANKKCIIDKNINSYKIAWDDFYYSFVDEQSLIVKRLYEAFLANIKQVSPADLDNLVSVFLSFNEKSKASDLVDAFILEYKDRSYLCDPDNFHMMKEVDDGTFMSKFEVVYVPSAPVGTIKEVLERISGKNGVGSNDLEILSIATDDEYYQYFKSLKGQDFISHISTCLKFGGYNSSDEKRNLIASKAKIALKRIGGESKLNEIRVAKFGV